MMKGERLQRSRSLYPERQKVMKDSPPPQHRAVDNVRYLNYDSYDRHMAYL